MSRKIALTVAGVVAAGVLGTAGVAAATSDSSTPTPTAAASSSAAPAGHAGDKAKKAKHELRARGMHGEWVLKGKDGKPVTLVSIRGQVTAVGASSVTVKADDGFTETFGTSSDTKVRGGATALSGVKVGAKGAVVGTKNGTALTARAVVIHK